MSDRLRYWIARRRYGWRLCAYDRCPHEKVGITKWCRDHVDRILAGEDAHLWPLRKNAPVEWEPPPEENER